MQMARIQDPREVEIIKAHLGHHTRIGEKFFRLWENDGDARLLARKFSHRRYVHTAIYETFEAQFAERIIADGGIEADAVPEKRKAVGKNCRRAPERKTQIRRKMLAIQFKIARKPVENEVQIELADDTDNEFVLAGHPVASPAIGSIKRLHEDLLLKSRISVSLAAPGERLSTLPHHRLLQAVSSLEGNIERRCPTQIRP
jgi:hypothetical protein